MGATLAICPLLAAYWNIARGRLVLKTAAVVVLGIASVVDPMQSSSWGTVGGLAAVAAGVGFVVLGERAQRDR
jgi:hypothetical protein